MKTKILVIEDEQDILDNIRLFLEAEKYEVITTNNGIEGIKLAGFYLPDLILCDIMMPGLDGYGILKKLSQDENLDCTPFIFLTAKAEKEDLRKGMEMGADDYIFKPFTYEELVAAIKTRLAKHKKIIAKVSFRKDAGEGEKDIHVDYNGNILIKYHNKTIPLKTKKIVYIKAENQYSQLVCEDNRRFLVRKSLESWENTLPADHFLRVHRSNLVNIEYVEKVDTTHGSAKVVLKDSQDSIEVSRRYLKKIKESFLLVVNIALLAVVRNLFQVLGDIFVLYNVY